jgi:hypothetical protein
MNFEMERIIFRTQVAYIFDLYYFHIYLTCTLIILYLHCEYIFGLEFIVILVYSLLSTWPFYINFLR